MFAGASLDENSGAFCELKANFFRLILTKAEVLAWMGADLVLIPGYLYMRKKLLSGRSDQGDVQSAV